MSRFYDELARWWPLLSPVEEYREEAAEFLRVFDAACPQGQTLLELGSGGGHNAHYFKPRFSLTLTDLSPQMLAVSKALNPEATHLEGDMRTLRLGRTFDVVFAHDAIHAMTTEADLRSAMTTAFVHCAPGGVALFVPDEVRERFESETSCGGSDGPDGSGVRYLEWNFDPNPTDDVGVSHYAFVLREADGSTRCLDEQHLFGMFSTERWVALLREVGFTVEVLDERTTEDRPARQLFLARRPR